MRVAVTGPTGFIGGHVLRDLAAAGHEVVAIGRGAAPNAFAGVDAVVHAAGRAHVRREMASDPESAFRAANVEYTREVAERAARAGVKRLIVLSSVAVYGARTGTIDAETPTAPVSPYGRSRLEGEHAALDVARRTGMDCVLLRLPMVYGPGMKGNPLILFRVVARSRYVPVGAIRNARSLCYVGNATAAVQGLLRADVPDRVATYLAADAEPVSTPDLVREIATALGRRVTLLPVPSPLLGLAAWAGTTVAGASFPLSTHALKSLTTSLVIDPAPLARAIGSAPPVTRSDALRVTAAWFTTAETM